MMGCTQNATMDDMKLEEPEQATDTLKQGNWNTVSTKNRKECNFSIQAVPGEDATCPSELQLRCYGYASAVQILS